MLKHASNLEFEEAAKFRDKIKKMKLRDLELITTKRVTK
jgi:protein-arginine kinase activator protein McsA